MLRITAEFTQTLEACQKLGKTNTAQALLQLSDGLVHEDNLVIGDIPMFLNKSVDEIGKLSFASKKRIEYNSWGADFASCSTNTQRVKAKVGKTMSKIFTSSFMIGFGIDNGDMETFTSQIKGMFLTNTNEFFSSTKDFDYYNWSHTSPSAQDGDGTLGSSCMRNDRCIDDSYFDLYEDSDTPVELITYNEGDGISSRALLWTTAAGKFLDRIYETSDGDIHRFKAYAQSQGWHTKERQSYNAKLGWTTPEGETKDIHLIIPVGTVDDHSSFPYMDTMTWAFKDSDDNWYLTNSKEKAFEIYKPARFMDFQSENGDYNTEYVQLVQFFDDDMVQCERAAFNESTITVYEENLPENSILSTNGVGDVEFERYDSNGDRNVFSIDDYYYHRSEVHRCNLSGNWYPLAVKFVMHESREVNPSYLIKVKGGGLVEKRNCTYYFNKSNRMVVGLSSTTRTVTDIFGMTRLSKECTYIGGRIDGYVLESELALVKLMESRTMQSHDVRENAINPLRIRN
mgnify:FL=1|tara:strand:+ start:1212 stop:2750 length:1539 start_codon:yes stop_codon:yes gene_type:complete